MASSLCCVALCLASSAESSYTLEGKHRAAASPPRPRVRLARRRETREAADLPLRAPLLTSEEVTLALAVRTAQELEEIRENLVSERTAARLRAAGSAGALAAAASGALLAGGPTEAEWARAAGLRTTAELRGLLERGREARGTLVMRNMGLVVKAAKVAVSRAGNSLALADLVQEGAVGLVRATETFDPDRRYRFSTYAVPWVRTSIQRAFQNENRTVRIPVWLYDVQAKLLAARAVLQRRGGKEPTDEQVAQAAGQTEERARAARSYFATQRSLDAEVRLGRGGSRTAGDDLVGKHDAPGLLAERDAEAARARAELLDLLDTLLNEERLVLRAVFGLDGEPEASVQELAAHLRVKPAAVTALLNSGLRKLRHPQRMDLLPQLPNDMPVT